MCDLGNQNKFAIFPILIGSQCATKDAIYLVICDLCAKSYLGETERSLHARFMEHGRAANKPLSDPEKCDWATLLDRTSWKTSYVKL